MGDASFIRAALVADEETVGVGHFQCHLVTEFTGLDFSQEGICTRAYDDELVRHRLG